MKNRVMIVAIGLSFLASISHMHAMEKEECNKPLSSYPTIVQAHQSLQEAYNKENEEIRAKAYSIGGMFFSSPSFLNYTPHKAIKELEPIITNLTILLAHKQKLTRLPAGGKLKDAKLFYHLSNLLYKLQQLKNAIEDVCPLE